MANSHPSWLILGFAEKTEPINQMLNNSHLHVADEGQRACGRQLGCQTMVYCSDNAQFFVLITIFTHHKE